MSAMPFAAPDRVAGPIPAVPAPLRVLIRRALSALLEPIEPIDPAREAAAPGPRAPGYAALDAPTYQRRGLRIAGLDDDVPAPTPSPTPSPPLSPPLGSTPRTPRPKAPARRAAR